MRSRSAEGSLVAWLVANECRSRVDSTSGLVINPAGFPITSDFKDFTLAVFRKNVIKGFSLPLFTLNAVKRDWALLL